jgi:hypothetical protein
MNGRVVGKVALASMLSAMSMLAVSADGAQRWGRPAVPHAGACFYQDANFRGDYFCTSAGEDLDTMPDGLNDRISSIRMFGGVDVTIFKDKRFSGRAKHLEGDVSNLQQLDGWNDKISSVRIGRGVSGGYGSGGRPAGDPDRIVRRAYQDILHREPDQSGLRQYRSLIIDKGWSEQQVREALRNSPEFRELNTMTREKAEAIVRRAYLSVLRREPDAGAQGFVNRVLRDRWSEEDVARELRKSDEYRNKKP